MNRVLLSSILLLCPLVTAAQLSVTVSPVKTTGQKAIVRLAVKNNFAEPIESARAVCFILDEQGRMVAQASRWVIGGSADKAGLAPGATNAFHFVIAATRPFTTTNLITRVTFSRLVLEGGKLADPVRDVTVVQGDAK